MSSDNQKLLLTAAASATGAVLLYKVIERLNDGGSFSGGSRSSFTDPTVLHRSDHRVREFHTNYFPDPTPRGETLLSSAIEEISTRKSLQHAIDNLEEKIKQIDEDVDEARTLQLAV